MTFILLLLLGGGSLLIISGWEDTSILATIGALWSQQVPTAGNGPPGNAPAAPHNAGSSAPLPADHHAYWQGWN